MKLEQGFIPDFNYCHCCGKRLIKYGILCTGRCWRRVERVRDAVKARIDAEKQGVKISSHQISSEFNDIQDYLSK